MNFLLLAKWHTRTTSAVRSHVSIGIKEPFQGCCVISSVQGYDVHCMRQIKGTEKAKLPHCSRVSSDFITPAGPLLARERIFMRENAINLLSLKAIRHHVACS